MLYTTLDFEYKNVTYAGPSRNATNILESINKRIFFLNICSTCTYTATTFATKTLSWT